MRKFKCSFFNNEVDLDDPITYNHLPSDKNILDSLMFKEIGYAFCYMNYFHPDVYDENEEIKYGQRKRVEEKIKFFCDNRSKHYDDVLWLQEQIFLFQDETENMC